jgi:FkbM family methyltransferase
LGKDLYLRRQARLPYRTLGSGFNAWTFHPSGLNERSVVYSFGVGLDISFDLALIENYGMPVYAFDPTPRSIEWVKTQTLPENFIFSEFGIADYDGVSEFSIPDDENFVSGRIGEENPNKKKIKVNVKRLQSIMQLYGHDKIDLLKMDIEGAEYDVIADILDSGIIIKQCLVEFHHRFEDIGIKRTREAVKKLNLAGYKIFHVSPSGEEIAFIKE